MTKITPIYQWTHREFDGHDPWAGNTPVRWSLAAYRLYRPNVLSADPGPPPVPSDSNAVPRRFAMGLVVRSAGRYRILPNAMQDLWRAGRVRDKDLPWLLHQVEGPLRRTDYPASVLLRLMLGLAIFLGVSALCLLGSAAWDASEFGELLLPGVLMGAISAFCIAVFVFWRLRRRVHAKRWAELVNARHGDNPAFPRKAV